MGRVGGVPLFLCAACICLDVSPAQTPCMSAGGNWIAYSRQCFFTGHWLQRALAPWMYVMSLWALGNMRWVWPLQAACFIHVYRCIANGGGVFVVFGLLFLVCFFLLAIWLVWLFVAVWSSTCLCVG